MVGRRYHGPRGAGDEAVVKLLLEKGADLDSKDNNGRTPLSWAARNGHDALVKLLFEEGADLDPKDTLWLDAATRGPRRTGTRRW